MAELTIAEATLNDVPAITAILNDAIKRTAAVWYDEQKTVAEMEDWLAQKQRENLPVLIACEGRVAEGFASYGPFRPWPGYRNTVEHALYVDARHRATGRGTALLSALIERARAAGLHAMVGGIESENTESLALHRKLGFVEVGRMPEVGRKFNRWLTLVFMQKIL